MGRRREVLRELSRAFPAPPELQDAMHNLYTQPDRIAAIMAASMVEAVLERLLRASFKPQVGERGRTLFEGTGPLANFAGKIQIADAFAIVTSPQAADLTRLKNIRNVFAHAATNVTFETEEIALESHGFVMLEAVRAVPAIQEAPHRDTFTGKSGYILVAILQSIIMNQEIRKRGGEPVYTTVS